MKKQTKKYAMVTITADDGAEEILDASKCFGTATATKIAFRWYAIRKFGNCARKYLIA